MCCVLREDDAYNVQIVGCHWTKSRHRRTPAGRISDILNARWSITADTSVRLGLFFGMDVRFWVNLQSEYDMRASSSRSNDLQT